jgi:hypothetical protein
LVFLVVSFLLASHKYLCVFLFAPIRATCAAHLILLDYHGLYLKNWFEVPRYDADVQRKSVVPQRQTDNRA